MINTNHYAYVMINTNHAMPWAGVVYLWLQSPMVLKGWINLKCCLAIISGKTKSAVLSERTVG